VHRLAPGNDFEGWLDDADIPLGIAVGKFDAGGQIDAAFGIEAIHQGGEPCLVVKCGQGPFDGNP